VGGIVVEPGELAKIAFVIHLAGVASRRQDLLAMPSSTRLGRWLRVNPGGDLGTALAVALTAVLLLVVQDDLGPPGPGPTGGRRLRRLRTRRGGPAPAMRIQA
jgi:cell division protein FtsW (lipid II flippase)